MVILREEAVCGTGLRCSSPGRAPTSLEAFRCMRATLKPLSQPHPVDRYDNDVAVGKNEFFALKYDPERPSSKKGLRKPL